VVILAADIGGSKLASGVVRSDGRLVATLSAQTPSGEDGEALYQLLVRLLRGALSESTLDQSDVRGIGVGCGGPMRYPEGEVSPLNIPAWRSFPLRSRLEADFGLPVLVDNDAKAFAVGEYWVGRGRGARCLLAMVVSTGVGGGVVENGRLIDGAHGNAGHIGHVVVYPSGPQCGCGGRGCLEAVASGTGLARQARAALDTGTRTLLSAGPSARDLSDAAAAGDPLALRLFRRAGVALGRAIASAAALFDLDRVVIGGGVSQASSFFLPGLRRELEARARLDFTRYLPVEISGGTIEASLAGAARLVQPLLEATPADSRYLILDT
jgi:glucokinase